MYRTFIRVVILALSIFPLSLSAQQAGQIDLSFNPFDTLVYGSKPTQFIQFKSMVAQPDDRVIVCGLFTSFHGTARKCLARLKTNGSIDSSFVPETSTSQSIDKLILLSNGQLLAIEKNASAVYHIVRFNQDGSRDAAFSDGTGANSIISDMVLQPDGKIIAVGNFTTYNAVTRQKMVRLNENGTIDTSFPSQLVTTTTIKKCVLQSDGKIIVAQDAALLRFNNDASHDATFSFSVSQENISHLAIQSNDNLLICTNPSIGLNNGRLRRTLPNGALDASFTTVDMPGATFRLSIPLSNGSIVLGGYSLTHHSSSENSLLLLSSTGSIDPGFVTTSVPDVNTAITLSDGSFVVNHRYGLSKVSPSGATVLGYKPQVGSEGQIKRCVLQPDGKIIIGGMFVAYNNELVKSLVRLHPDGSRDYSFASIVSGEVETISLQPDGKILVGGLVSFDGDNTFPNLRRLNADGTIDTTEFHIPTYSPWQSLFSSKRVYATAIQADGKVLVAYSVEGHGPGLLRLNSDGTVDQTFLSKTLVGSSIWKIIVQPDGKILIAGKFVVYDGKTNSLARLNPDGSLDATFTLPNETISETVFDIALQPDGKIVLVGTFQGYANNGAGSIIRINSDGSYDSGFTNGNPMASPTCVEYQADGKLIFGGTLTTYGGIARQGIVRVHPNGALDLTFDPKAGVNGTIYDMQLHADGSLLAVGTIFSYNGIGRSNIVKIKGDAAIDCSSAAIEVSVTQSGDVLTASATNVSYQWWNCTNNTLVNEATGNQFTIPNNDDYSVIITKDGCKDTSSCYSTLLTGLQDEQAQTALTIYPNPSSNAATLSVQDYLQQATVRVLNARGEAVATYEHVNGNSFQLDIAKYANGLYFIEVREEGNFRRTKLIKQ